VTKLMDFNEMNRRLDPVSNVTLEKALRLIRERNKAHTLARECGLTLKQANAVFAFADYSTRGVLAQHRINTCTALIRRQLVQIVDADGRELQLHWDRDLRKMDMIVSITRYPSKPPRRVPLRAGSGEFNFWAQWARRNI